MSQTIQQSQEEITIVFANFERQVPSNLAKDDHNAQLLTRFILDHGGLFTVEGLNAGVKFLMPQLHWVGLSSVEKIVEKIVEVPATKTSAQLAEERRQKLDQLGLIKRKTEWDRDEENEKMQRRKDHDSQLAAVERDRIAEVNAQINYVIDRTFAQTHSKRESLKTLLRDLRSHLTKAGEKPETILEKIIAKQQFLLGE